MNDTDKKREALKSAYSGKKWAAKVNKMSEAQVIATYLRLKGQGKV